MFGHHIYIYICARTALVFALSVDIVTIQNPHIDNMIGADKSAAKFLTTNNQPPLIVVSVYRPPNNDNTMANYIEETITALMAAHKNAVFWIGDPYQT